MSQLLKTYSDNTLMSMTKSDIIEMLRYAEHNRKIVEERLARHIEIVKDWQPVKHGYWIEKPNIIGEAYCSECGYALGLHNTKYCPNCGAMMDKE